MDLCFSLPSGPIDESDLAAVPDVAGVFRVRFARGRPYIGKTSVLRRRLRRILRPRANSTWTRAGTEVQEAWYQPTGSAFESGLLLCELAREDLARDYRRFLKLRTPPLVKVHLSNRFPRTYVTTQISGQGVFFGPFMNRTAAEKFESGFLDLFEIRRCSEELEPSLSHPGCIYGEMGKCSRPCQEAVSDKKYQVEVGRVLDFLSTRGHSLLREIEQSREQASQEQEFEEAARQHRQLDKVREALKLAGDLARNVDQLFAVVVQKSLQPESVDLWFVNQGFFQPKVTFRYAPDGRSISLDQRLREMLSQAVFTTSTRRRLADDLALLRRWYHSSWREGEIVLIDGLDRIPYRRLVNAISRVGGRPRANRAAVQE